MATDVVPAADRGLAYGDGVFRTLAVHDGRLRRWNRQYGKLAADCERLRLACPSAEALQGDVTAAAGAGDAAVKIIVTRGAGERGYRIPPHARANCIVIASPLPAYPSGYAADGIAVCVCTTRLGTQTALAGVKHLNRLENVLARSEWEGDAYAEGLMCDVEGRAIGGTMSNLFIVEGGRLRTPDLRRCGVAGVTRELIVERAARDGVACTVENLSVDRVLEADEVFFVNSLIDVWPVRTLGTRRWAPGPLARQARTWLEAADCHD